jgi:glycosyltransferase involved in cell wall biosynthesis
VLVVPLVASTRSAGQQTYLNGMALGAVTIVCDPLGAAYDYIKQGVNGVVVPADPSALAAAITDALRPERQEHYLAMRRRARDVVLAEFSPERYRRRLLQVAGLDPGLRLAPASAEPVSAAR